MKEFLLRGGAVLDSESGSFAVRDVLVRGGLFAASSQVTEHTEIIDMTGKTIVPGLIDVHTHGRAGSDFNRHERIDYPAMLSSYAAAGTTSVMATLASDTLSSLFASLDSIRSIRISPLSDGARVLGTHLEGRYLSPTKRGAHALSLLAQPSLSELEELVFRMRPLPAHISLAPELDGGLEFIRRAVALGVTVGIAHSDADAYMTKAALSAGAGSFTHLYNAMRQMHHREPGNTGVGLISDAYAELICDGQHVHPDMVKLAYRAKGAERLVLITDSMEAAGCPDGEYEIAGMPVKVSHGRALTCDGALAGSLLSLFDGVTNFCRFTGATYADALLCATKNPARMVGVYDMVGSISPGKRADFLVLDGNAVAETSAPRLEKVCLEGIFAF